MPLSSCVRVAWSLLFLSGCGASFGTDVDRDEGDGGPPVACEDGGACPGSEGPPGSDAEILLCADLVWKTCGAEEGPRCEGAPACVAAELLQRHEPEACEAALSDDVSFPACAYDACEQLVQKVCGGLSEPAPCDDAPGCAPARALLGRAEGEDAAERTQALTSCQQSLRDDLVFARCLP